MSKALFNMEDARADWLSMLPAMKCLLNESIFDKTRDAKAQYE